MPDTIEIGYAPLQVKAYTDGAAQRTFSGFASTPDLDRAGHSVDPAGITFANPLPLLFHHDRTQPIGTVTLGAPTADGLPFEATIPTITEPGRLRDRCLEAAQCVGAGLIRGVSIGFRVIGDGVKFLKDGTVKLSHIEVLELSLVTVPANAHANILTIKSAAFGPNLPGVAGPLTKAPPMDPQTITEQITGWDTKRTAHVARMNEIMSTATAAGTTLNEQQTAEYDGLGLQVKSIADHIGRLRTQESLQIQQATPIVPATTVKAASEQRGGVPFVQIKSNVAPGTAFIRAACAKVMERTGQIRDAAEYAKRWDDSTPEVALYLKAAVAPGTTTDATWASPLVNQGIAKDFIELLRPATILGKVPGLRIVPFNTKVPSQSAGGTYGWVGEAKPKPVTKLAFASTALGVSKAAGIIVLTKELIMLSDPNAEDLVRRDMIAGIAQFLDSQFIDPAVAAVAGVNPASITNGAPTAVATANPMADIMGLISHFATNNISVEGVTFIMSAANALSLSFRSNLDGSPQYPGVSVNGGTYKGLTFITSQAAGANVIALQPSLVLYADGGIEIDASQEASLQMDSAPMSPSDATTVYVSLWQTNSVGLRAERFVNWAKANANAVKYLTAAAWPAPTGGAVVVEQEPPPSRHTGKA